MLSKIICKKHCVSCSKLTQENEHLKNEIQEIEKKIFKQKKTISRLERFYNGIEKLAESDVPYKYQAYRRIIENNKAELYLCLKKFEEMYDLRKIYKFNLVMYDVYCAKEVCKAQVSADYDSGQMELVAIDTEKEYWRRGIASFLLKNLKEYCRLNSYTRIYGKLYADTPAELKNLRKFYEKNGFTCTENDFFCENFVSK
ncbi:MAG: GNAT family N-acetyltransferase [Defluviitaleaceae bacterium]|nr:GNAT family N-acetyltransferase [Defluviitaleaceae bacterium]